MDDRVSRASPLGAQSDISTPWSQQAAPSANLVASQVIGSKSTNSANGASSAVIGDYGELAETIANKLDRVPEKYQSFLLRLCETLDRSSADLAADFFPALPPAYQEQALLALLAAECAGDAFIHDRVVPLPLQLRLTRDSRSAKRLIPFDGRIFELTDLHVYVFGSENPADLLGEDIVMEAWGHQWQEREQTADTATHPLPDQA